MNNLRAAFAVLLCLLLQTVGASRWPQHVALDKEGHYHLYWKEDDNHGIIFRVEVKTKGYVGFGLSPRGLMPNSDMVTGWVKDGKVYFQDRHANGRKMPIVDENQNWFLTYATENSTHTILEFQRKLDTCDKEDMVIDDSTMRVIYAYSERDPPGEDPIYHDKHRGYKSLLLLQEKFFAPNDPDMLHWDVTSPNYDITPYESLYMCQIFKSPALDRKHHIVLVRPLIQEGHTRFVHHMVLYECLDGKADQLEQYVGNGTFDCLGQFTIMPEAMANCQAGFVGWAMGGEDMVYPEHAGQPLEAGPGKYYMLEMHYDNPQRIPGVIDHSGMRLFYTPHVRKYDAGSFFFGVPVNPRVFVPPFQDEYVVIGHSNPECMAPEIPKQGLKIFGMLLHSHLITKSMRARHFRGRKELPPVVDDKNYDFHYQEFRYFQDEITFLPHDQMTIECSYNSSKRPRVTFGGGSTREEMCLGHCMYYPAMKRQFLSQSVPTFDEINKALKTNFSDVYDLYQLFSFDWSTVNISQVQKRMRYSKHYSECYVGLGPGTENITSLVSYPENYIPYVPKLASCHRKPNEQYTGDPYRGVSLRKRPWMGRQRKQSPRRKNPLRDRTAYRNPYVERNPYLFSKG